MVDALSFDICQDFTDNDAEPRPSISSSCFHSGHLLRLRELVKENRNPMVETARTLQTGLLAEPTGPMVARWLRLTWPRHTEKEASRFLDVDCRTVRSWLEGNRPNGSHFDQMVATWGEPFTSFVFAPLYGREDEANRYERAKAQIASLNLMIDEMRGRGA